MLNNGDSVNITDIESQPMYRSDPGNTLVCNTTLVNMNCCRNAESGMGAIGNWYTPSGPAVITLTNVVPNTDTLYRVVHTQQIRLGSEGAPIGPLGIYTCRVPNEEGVEVMGSISIINILSGKGLTEQNTLVKVLNIKDLQVPSQTVRLNEHVK